MARKRTEEEIKEIVENLGYIYIVSRVVKRKSKVIIRDKDGYKYDVVLRNILSGQGISFVEKRNPYSLENISLWLKINNSQFKLLENNEYTRNTSKLNLYCNNCKDHLKTSWNNILHGKGCGVCHGFQVGEYHNLAVQRPDIAKEWHRTLNGDLTPKDVTRASNKKVWWICPNGHEYFSRIADRTTSGNGCSVCADERKESRIATELKELCKEMFGINNVNPEHKMFKNPKTGSWLRCDIYIGEKESVNGVYIEVHGEQHYIVIPFWHKNKEEFEYKKHLDRLKRKFARKYGTYIEIDLRKIKTTEQATEFIESILKRTQ